MTLMMPATALPLQSADMLTAGPSEPDQEFAEVLTHLQCLWCMSPKI